MLIDLATGIAIVVPLLSFLGFLVQSIRSGDVKRIDHLEDQNEKIRAEIAALRSELVDSRMSVAGLIGAINQQQGVK